MDNFSFVGNADVNAIENLYHQYKSDPDSIDHDWQRFFQGFEFAKEDYSEENELSSETIVAFQKEINVINLIGAYRQRGHLFAKTNPIRERRKHGEPLVLENFNLSENDLDTVFKASTRLGLEPSSLRTIIAHLEQTYCGSIGAEFRYIQIPEAARWLLLQMEKSKNTPNFTLDEKKHLLKKLNQAVIFENFLHTKFVGQKRFSLEGAEAIIPAMDAIIEKGAELGIKEFVIGMAHRGRLNILANIMGKTYEDIFTEFEGKLFEKDGFEGDVKYHLGYSSDIVTRKGNKVHLSLTPNPSHLEAVNPVVTGIVRAKIDQRYQGDESKIAPILIHGDASIGGQGIIYEVLQMSLLDGYRAGGTIHVILNNQVGFTTNYLDGRSSTYCTDIAKLTYSPVFHVNGDDAEAVVYAIQMCMEFRQKYNRDVFLDVVCYRKHGHNEADEPRFTQPLLYQKIAKHPNPREVYFKKLLENGDVSADLAKTMEREFKQELQDRLDEAKQKETAKVTSYLEGDWTGLRMAALKDFESSPKTGVAMETLQLITEKITDTPNNLNFFPKIKKLLEARKQMVFTKNSLDWGMAETLAYGTLLYEGENVRISGQDVQRGTFSHRHAVITLQETEEKYVPLQNLKEDQGKLDIYNSLLSEYGVLGFEFGYSMAAPKGLVIWEAQFGDFANGAQIIIDQFICSSETKWQRMIGLVLLLPHGYEGQGPEHSSARLERFMTLCADNNMQVINCTTPANMFHALRRQLARSFRKPLIAMSPKSLLRHPQCVSKLEDLAEGTRFQEIMDDDYVTAKSVKRVLFCSGKVYYDLLERQQSEKRKDVAIVRFEQLYPIAYGQIEQLKKRYKSAKQWFWVQEESENLGAWSFMLRKLTMLPTPLKVIARKESASPSTGFAKMHIAQQKAIVDTAFEV